MDERSVPEADWQYMKKVMPELLDVLSKRINHESEAILSDRTHSAHDNYLRLWSHMKKSDRVVGDCFNDWRRSTLFLRLFAMREHGLLPPEHFRNLSEDTRERFELLDRIGRNMRRSRRRRRDE